MLFCVHFRVLGKKVAFKTDVDEFSSFELKGILNSIYTASGTAATENIVLQVGQHLSPKYVYIYIYILYLFTYIFIYIYIYRNFYETRIYLRQC